jgi:hypothetical protein
MAVFSRNNCIGCHSQAAPALDLRSAASAFDTLVGRTSRLCSTRVLVTPSAPASSHLINKLSGVDMGCGSRMPKGGSAMPAADVDIVRAWIARGAPND